MVNGKTLTFALILSLFGGRQALATDDFFYSDYLTAIKTQQYPHLSWYFDSSIKIDRAINLLTQQAKSLKEDEVDQFSNMLFTLSSLPQYQGQLERINTLVLYVLVRFSRNQEALKFMSTQPQTAYLKVLQALVYEQLGQYQQAKNILTDFSPEDFQTARTMYLNLSKDLIINRNADFKEFLLPNKAKQELGEQLEIFYKRNGLYDLALKQEISYVRLIQNSAIRRTKLLSVINFAEEYGLVERQIEGMEIYLLSFLDNSNPPIEEGYTQDEQLYISRYTDAVFSYYLDKRNKSSLVSRHKLNELLEPLEIQAKNNRQAKKDFLQHRIELGIFGKSDVFYDDVIALAILLHSRQLIFDYYTSSVPIFTQVKMQQAYFSIPVLPKELFADNDIVMAQALSKSLVDCRNKKSDLLVFALKGHEFMVAHNFDEAEICFSLSGTVPVDIGGELGDILSDEQQQMAYRGFRRDRDFIQLNRLALLMDKQQVLSDAAMLNIAENSNIIEVMTFSDSVNLLSISSDDAIDIEKALVKRLRSERKLDILESRLIRNPVRNSLLLARLAANEDAVDKAVGYFLTYLGSQARDDSSIDKIAAIRYIDSHYDELPILRQSQIGQLSKEHIELANLLKLKELNKKIVSSFVTEGSGGSIYKRIKRCLQTYKELNTPLSETFHEANYTQVLLMQLYLNNQLVVALSHLKDEAISLNQSKIVKLLKKQIEHLVTKNESLRKTALSQRIEGVEDYNIISALYFSKYKKELE